MSNFLDPICYPGFFKEATPCPCTAHSDLRAHLIAHGFGGHDNGKAHICIECNPWLSNEFGLLDSGYIGEW